MTKKRTRNLSSKKKNIRKEWKGGLPITTKKPEKNIFWDYLYNFTVFCECIYNEFAGNKSKISDKEYVRHFFEEMGEWLFTKEDEFTLILDIPLDFAIPVPITGHSKALKFPFENQKLFNLMFYKDNRDETSEMNQFLDKNEVAWLSSFILRPFTFIKIAAPLIIVLFEILSQDDLVTYKNYPNAFKVKNAIISANLLETLKTLEKLSKETAIKEKEEEDKKPLSREVIKGTVSINPSALQQDSTSWIPRFHNPSEVTISHAHPQALSGHRGLNFTNNDKPSKGGKLTRRKKKHRIHRKTVHR